MSDLFLNAAFAAFAGMTVLSALLVVVFRNLLHAAVALFFALAGVAGLYILLGADFLGVTQLVVYAGGILVLIIFGVFLTSRIYDLKAESVGRKTTATGVLISGGVFAAMASVITRATWASKEPTYVPTTKAIGELFLTRYLLPFELISLLLLFAMVGAVLIVRKELRDI